MNSEVQEVIMELHILSSQMQRLAEKMCLLGGEAEMHAMEMKGAARIVHTWIEGLQSGEDEF